MYDAAIFDKDGVLLDSVEDGFKWMDRIRVREAARIGIDLTIDEAESIAHAKSREELVQFLREKGMSWKQLMEIESRVEREKRGKVRNGDIQLFSQVQDILEGTKLPKAVVSNSPRTTTEFVLNYFNIDRYFDAVYAPELDPSGSFLDRRKPNPSMLREAVNALEARNPVMIGDTSADVRAAKRLGIDSILVDRHGLSDLNPTHRVDSLSELKKLLMPRAVS
ncbi:MAG: HAD family hydrolase [Candidatus Nanohaloarchaea archaeon]